MMAETTPQEPPASDGTADWAAEVAAKAKSKAAKRKTRPRPRLTPVSISPEKPLDASYLDELGFGDIVTGATSTPKEEDGKIEAGEVAEEATEKLSQSGEAPANAITPRDESEGELSEIDSAEGTRPGSARVSVGSAPDGGRGEMAYSSLAGPAAVDIQALCLNGIDACCGNDEDSVPDQGQERKGVVKKMAECCDVRGRGGSDVSASFELSPLNKNDGANERDTTVELSLVVNDAEYMGDASAIMGEELLDDGGDSLAFSAVTSAADGDKNGEAAAVAKDLVDEIVASAVSNVSAPDIRDRDAIASVGDSNATMGISRIDDVSSVASTTTTSSSSDSDSDAESETSSSEMSDIPADTELQRLQREIGARQKRLARLLRGKEGTAYARLIREQEEYVNGQLLGRAQPEAPSSNGTDKSLLGAVGNGSQSPGKATTAAVGNAKESKRNPFRTVRSIFLDEYFHTLPGALSLVVHCALYVTIYACVSKALTWMCDAVVVGLTGWDDDAGNTFDLSSYESAFYLAVLILSLMAAKLTGVLYDWNENRSYHKRVEFCFRNKWHAGTWDAKAMDFFLGGELREEYEAGGKSDTPSERGRRWGPRLKHLVDLLAFFVCYKSVDYFIYSLGALPLSDITDSVVEGLPSRHVQMHRDRRLKENGRSYACHSVVTVLRNPYAADMLEWIAKMQIDSDETRGWVRNANECGWLGPAESDGDSDEESGIAGELSDPTELPAFLSQKRVLSALDDEYLEEAITEDAYANLVGETELRFYDPAREVLFLLASTAVGFGLLSYFDVPFLLI